MFRVVETFSGIGAQAKALSRIGREYEIINTCDWDINAMLAYCQIHKGSIDVRKYNNVNDDEINEFLGRVTLSMDGKMPMSERAFSKLSTEFKRVIYTTIRETNNLVSITDVKGRDLDKSIDLLTYSFPCQDLSLCGCWHGNKSGIDRNAHNRSGMLWEVERILKEMHKDKKELPHFLVMENVTNILSQTNKNDFDDWKNTLAKLGYYNKIYRLNAKNFGVPQKRERAYMVSILIGKDRKCKNYLDGYFNDNNLENLDIAKKFRSRKFKLKNVLKLDYSKLKYKIEADTNQPNDTPSRRRIFKENDLLFDGNTINEIFVNTVTTKQDRNPNSGLIIYDNGKKGKSKWRYLTPRECFLLMGFDERDYNRAIKYNPNISGRGVLLTNEKMIKMAGNSICVDVLEAIFRQIFQINDVIFS